MSVELLIEIGTEEIPAGFMPPALKSLKELAQAGLTENRIGFDTVRTLGTPRRLVLYVTGVETRQPDVVEEAMGPSVSVAFDADGNPTKAGQGFARSKGVDPSELLRIQTDKGEYVGIRRSVKGLDSLEVLAGLVPEWMGKIPFKKTMRWGTEETAFVRPIHWITALLGTELIEFEYAGTKSSATSRGHRFHAPELFEVKDAADYFAKIESAYVMVDQDKRREEIRVQVAEAAASMGGKVLEDDELLETINFLVEYPTAVAGSYDANYLDLPEELLILSMKTHQKYYAVVDDSGKLLNHFITVSNTRVRDMSVVARGNERVLHARLADARFFYDEDQKSSLEEQAEGLKTVVFQTKLGTSWEKVERFRAMSAKLADKLCPDAKGDVDRIAKLCKADLVTLMVFEFPEIQGIVGREYALRAGEPELIAKGIQQHYRPVQAGGELPETAEADCVSLGDKIDTIAGCFGVGLIPSGAADPYALRRQTMGILRIMMEKNYRISLDWLFDEALSVLSDKLTRSAAEVRADLGEFFKGRLETLLAGKGYPGDVIAATLSAGFDDVVDVAARAAAVETVREKGELATLAGTFKRAANILKKAEGAIGDVDESLLAEDAEKELWKVYSTVSDAMTTSVERGDYVAFFAEAAKLKVVVDGFFDAVMVMADDDKIRGNRIALMGAVTSLFGRVADFTRITT